MTAEKILKKQPKHDFDDLMYTKKEALSAMHEFAAQEVEAYKARLKEAVRARWEIGMLPISDIIDTVK